MKFTVSKKIVAIAAVLLFSATADAQNMITFESGSSAAARSKKKRENAKNSVTVGIASAFSGYTPFYYERTVLPMLTVQAGVGFTYRSFINDFTQLVLGEEVEKTNKYTGFDDNIVDHYQSYQYRKMRIGQYFSFSPKLYFNESALHGIYIAPMLEIKNYRYDAQLANTSVKVSSYSDDDIPRVSETMKEKLNCTDLTFNFGGHFQTRGHVALGWNVGLGVRSLSSDRLDVGIRLDRATGDFRYENAMRSFTDARPLFNFNFIVGGWF